MLSYAEWVVISHNAFYLQEMEPVKKELTIPEPTKADKDAAKGRRLGRPQKRGPQKASTVLHNSGSESDHEETPKSGEYLVGNYMTGSSPSHILHERLGRNTIS